MSDEQETQADDRPMAQQQLDVVQRALEAAQQHLEFHDQSNAALHLSPVVYRPLTHLVQAAVVQVAPIRQALEAARCDEPGYGPYRRLTVSVDAEVYERLVALSRAAGLDSEPNPVLMAETVLAEYGKVLGRTFCFEHRREGCGDERGQHVDPPQQRRAPTM